MASPSCGRQDLAVMPSNVSLVHVLSLFAVFHIPSLLQGLNNHMSRHFDVICQLPGQLQNNIGIFENLVCAPPCLLLGQVA